MLHTTIEAMAWQAPHYLGDISNQQIKMYFLNVVVIYSDEFATPNIPNISSIHVIRFFSGL